MRSDSNGYGQAYAGDGVGYARGYARRLLLASAALVATAGQAGAQAIVNDPPAIVQRAIQHGETLLQWGSTIRSWKEQLEGMQRQYMQIRATYDSLTNGRSFGSVGQMLMDEAMRRPGAPSNRIAGALAGVDTFAASSSYMARNSFRAPTGTDYEALEMQRRSQSLANIQSNAMEGIETAERRITGLLEFLGIVESQKDLQASAALGNRVASEQVALQNEADRLKRLEIMIATQRDVNTMRDREAGRAASQSWYDNTAGAFDVPWR
jgi:hypothetical protein